MHGTPLPGKFEIIGQSDKRGKNKSEIKTSGQKSQFCKQANFECPKKAILDPQVVLMVDILSEAKYLTIKTVFVVKYLK